MNNVVQKATPEEASVIANLASMIQQLQAMGVGDQALGPGQGGDQGPSGGQPTQGAAFKSGEGATNDLRGGGEFDRTEDPQNDTSPEGPTARRPQMRNSQIQKADGHEENAFADEMEGNLLDTQNEGADNTPGERPVVAKDIESTHNEGTQNLDNANKILFDDLPASTQENVKEIRKALNAIGLDITRRARPVAKSMVGGPSPEVAELRGQVAFLANTLGEMIEGMAVAKSVDPTDEFGDPIPNDRQVRKSGPRASYSGQGDINDVLKALVSEIRNDRRDEESERNPWDRPDVVHKSMRSFTEKLGGIAGGLWPTR
jgi:hypothetical protein